ncbi:MAG: PHP domain-containing protein [Ruminococcaceae bacterium]|nr:PHP domain-containing protein [Oscillospiraceae bacterium]
MKKHLLPEKGNFYKANLHCHSTISDGKWTVEEIKKNYMAEGYSIIAYTDHHVFVTHNDLTDDKFLALNGYEINFDQKLDTDMDKKVAGRLKKTCHLCLIATDKNRKVQKIVYKTRYLEDKADLFCLEEGYEIRQLEYNPEVINKTMKEAKDDGFYITYNHPVWSLESKDEYCSYHGMNAMEMVNYGSLCVGLDEHNSIVYDDMLRGGERIFCVATDDNHDSHPIGTPKNDSFGGFTVIKADALEYEKIMSALEKGDFYASEAPEIHELWYEDGRVGITTSEAVQISFTTGTRRSRVEFAEKGEIITEASFELQPSDVYFRITVRDCNGKEAYTNAYFLDKLPIEQ